MNSFNIFGACVSRDIFPIDTGFKINQFVSFTSPLSLYLGRNTNNDDIVLFDQFLFDKLEWGSNFAKRCMRLDNNKNSLDYLAEKKSDWLILDLADYRLNIIQFANNFFTVQNLYQKNKSFWDNYLDNQDGFAQYSVFDANDEFAHFSQEEIFSSLEWFCLEISKLYNSDQIILHEYYLVDEYVTKGGTIVICLQASCASI